MKLKDLYARFFKSGPKKTGRRGYSAAQINRLTHRWIMKNLTSDATLMKELSTMRARSRELSQNNDHVKRFLNMLKTNVVGPRGIQFKNKAINHEGVQDTAVNKAVEEAFKKWGTKANTSVDGKISWVDAQRLFIETVARDGEVLVRKVKGFDNEFGFALQFIEADHLDENYNEEMANGNRICMGVEYNQWRRPVAYHLLTRHPGDYSYRHYPSGKLYDRVPAEEIIHDYILERPTQSRGVPWAHTAMFRLNMLGGYEEAELVASRAGACKMGFFTSKTGEEYTGDDVDTDGDIITEAEAGSFEQLPAGTDFKEYDPQHPNNGFGAFVKSVLRGVASGLNVSYNSLTSDLEGVNYSSIRTGLLDERDSWKIIQGWMIEHFCEEVIKEWYPMAILSGQLPISPSKLETIAKPSWRPRGWAWVDPEKDQSANIDAVNNGLKTRGQVLAEQGQDLEEVFEELANENTLMKKYGLEFNVTKPQKNPSKSQTEDPQNVEQSTANQD